MVRSRSRPSSPPFSSLSLSPSRLKPPSPSTISTSSASSLLSFPSPSDAPHLLLPDPPRPDHRPAPSLDSPLSCPSEAKRPSLCCGRQQRLAPDSPSSASEAKRKVGLQTALCCGRQRLQRHWMDVAGNVSIPESWGREHHLQEWVGFGIVEDALAPVGLMTARSALVSECQRRSAATRNRTSPASAAASAAADVGLR